MSTEETLGTRIKALTFDVFGTVVDWRSSVEATLESEVLKKLNAADFSSLSPQLQDRLKTLMDSDISEFAQDWRNSYGVFTASFIPGRTPWKDIDTHHYDSLIELLEKWQLTGLFDAQQLKQLSLVWHRLTPWPDSSEGIHKLATKFVTSTLSNGNQSLLKDLDRFGNLGFQRIISAEDFKAYKPNHTVYLGAAKSLGVKPEEVAMVAAHLGDLHAARAQGFYTIYVERPAEEAWQEDEERYKAAKNWVDIWVSQGQDGFVEVARRLGATV